MDFIGFGLPDFHKNIDLIEIYHLYKNLILSSKWFTSKKHNIKSHIRYFIPPEKGPTNEKRGELKCIF